MSKIAETKALKAYPMDEYEFDKAKKSDIERKRFAYIKGYEQAMKDFLEKGEKFFKSMYETMGKPNLGDKTIELFKNYMQNESEN